MRLHHPKANLSARGRDIYLMRGEHGLLSVLRASGIGDGEEYARNLTLLRTWAATKIGADKVFTKNMATTAHEDIGLTKKKVDTLVTYAAERGDIESVNHKVNNRAHTGHRFKEGITPITQASPNGTWEMVEEWGDGGVGGSIARTPPPRAGDASLGDATGGSEGAPPAGDVVASPKTGLGDATRRRRSPGSRFAGRRAQRHKPKQ